MNCSKSCVGRNRRYGSRHVWLTGIILLGGKAFASVPCGDWHTVSSPNPASVNRALHITGRGSDDLWLLGSAGPTYPGTAMIWRRQESDWTTIPLPDTSPLGTLPTFNAIAQLPSGDVLVGGDVRTSYPIYNQPFVARWTGADWTEVMPITLRPQTVYPYGPRGGLVADLFAASPSDVWVFGYAASMGTGGGVPMAAHYDGSTWTEFETPIVSNRTNEIIAANGSASNDVWAVGVQRDIAGPYRPFTMHWGGEVWTYHAVPAGLSGSLDAVTVLSPTDAWAIGASILIHWNGNSWESMSLPVGASSAAIEAVAADDLWIAHMTGGYFHWDGVSWTYAPSPFAPPAGRFTQIRDFVQFNACDLWAAGSVLSLDGSAPSTTILEHLVGSILPGDLNCDAAVNNFDIDPFVMALTDADAYAAAYPNCDLIAADTNADGVVNNFDIDPFVALLAGG